ncbi:MAG: LCP family protein [Spirochaetales bacterium]
MEHKTIPIGRHAIFIILIVCIMGITAITVFVALRTDAVEEVLKNDHIIKLLLVIEDGGEALSTTILSYYPVSYRGSLIDILGNTGGIYSSIGRMDRIDAVYKEKGIESYHREVEKLVGMTIPFYIEISLTDFSVLTDLLGGFNVSVLTPIDDIVNGVYYLLPSGQINLDSDKIITYITYENEDTDDKEYRIQNTIVAFFKALNTKRNDIFRNNTFSRYANRMESNLSAKDLYTLLETISNVDAERLFPQAITGTLRIVDGKEILFPHNDGQLIKEVVNQKISALISETEFSRIYTLEIQNGTTVQGLAQNTATLLSNTGYKVLAPINADRNNYEHTYIIDHIGNADVAKALGDFIGCTNIIQERSTDNDLVDFTVVLGSDFNGRYVR